MSYQTPLTISSVIRNIEMKKYLLPSIQREFVWSTGQIEKLFDSLMMDYPINSFLFWKVPRDKIQEFKFYEFLRDYHQKDQRHNPKANPGNSDDIMAVLDGQQRLTSLYIGLKGTYAYKLPYKRWDNTRAYPKRKLYLNLLQPAEDRADFHYDFRFLTDEEVKEENWECDENGNQAFYWFPVGDILNFQEQFFVNTYLIENGLMTLPQQEQALFANQALSRLFSAIHTTGTIVPYMEESTELDKVLNIFIRVNSGGTPLSYSDLLLSFATAQWEDMDARETINACVDELNDIGRGFHINKDMVLKACLVLCDFPDISFKVDNFNKTNMLLIEKNWDEITTAMRLAFTLVASYGFNRDNITSNNAMIPIAYYILQRGNPESFVDSSKYIDDRKKIRRWFVSAILLRVFSFNPDGVLRPMREIIQKNHKSFPLEKIQKRFRGTNRDVTFTEESLNNLLWTTYGSGDALIILSVLYPWADLRNNFHIDHIFPKSLFTEKRLKRHGVSAENVPFYIENVNYIGNLQLLEEIPNKEKNNKEFEVWLDKIFPDPAQRRDYMQKHYIPDVSLAFTNFEEFINAREQLLLAALRKELISKC